LTVPTNLDAPASTILSDDVARYLARAATIDGALPPRVDLGMQQPTNIREIAAELSAALGRTITASAPPAFVRTVVFRVLGMFDRSLRENLKAMEYVASGQYVADTTQQARLFGPPPTLRASIRAWLKSANLGASS
jgi:nucleoside-diphosphate-sugar epimerase